VRKSIPLFALPILVVSCAGIQLQRDAITDPGQLLFNGHTNPAVNCYACHNGDGRGATLKGPDLSGPVAQMPDAPLLAVIEKGATFMPAFGGQTSLEERQQMVGWLRKVFGCPEGTEPESLDVEAVEEVERAEESESATETP